MICRRCGAKIEHYEDDVYFDERESPFCRTYQGDPVAPTVHAPMLRYSRLAAAEGGNKEWK